MINQSDLYFQFLLVVVETELPVKVPLLHELSEGKRGPLRNPIPESGVVGDDTILMLAQLLRWGTEMNTRNLG